MTDSKDMIVMQDLAGIHRALSEDEQMAKSGLFSGTLVHHPEHGVCTLGELRVTRLAGGNFIAEWTITQVRTDEEHRVRSGEGMTGVHPLEALAHQAGE